MKTIYKIAKTELRTLFYSPIAWLILIIFTFQCSMAFSGLLGEIVRNKIMGYDINNITLRIFGGWDGLFSIVQQYLYLYIPLLTMSLMSRELGSGSIKLLYSSPVTNSQIILGKYLSMMIFGLLLVGVLCVYFLVSAFAVKDFDYPVVLSGLAGIYLLICAYAAIGLFMSSLTAYQIVAAIGTLSILAILTYVRNMWQDIAFIRDLTYWFAISGRANEFVSGLICSEDVLYFIIVVALFLGMTIIRLQARRQRASRLIVWGKYLTIWVVALFLGYLSSRPVLMSFCDVTATQQNTLTPHSQDIVKRLKGELTITNYTNILDKYFWITLPSRVNEDLKMFKQYLRFKPEIKMKYVYYYDTVRNESLGKKFEHLTMQEKAQKIIEINGLDPDMILTPEQIRQKIDLSSEGNRFVRLLERENGESTFLRVFDDNMIFPYETEITAALKRIAMKLPAVGFLTGHGERNTERLGERDYGTFAQLKTFRYSLVNQGFDYQTVTLTGEIPTHIHILVIADMRRPLTETERAHMDQYIARGGNLMIIGEPGRQEVMNPLLEPFGVELTASSLVQPKEGFQPDLIVARPGPEAGEIAYQFGFIATYNGVITMPGCCGLEYSTDKGFKVSPIFVTDSTGCWNEVETTDFIEDTVRLNTRAGEVEKSYTTALALSRKVGTQEQKILIFGDADCISNSEFSRRRNGIMASNYSIIQGSFFWLSDYEVPIDVRRPQATDNQIYTGETGMRISKIMLMWVFPGILLLLSLFIWVRRRSR